MKKLILLMIIASITAWAGPAAASETDGINIHGFISQGYLQSGEYNYLANDTKDGSFEYNETGINFGKQLTNKLHIGLQLFARDLGDTANNKVNLDWAYADYLFQDWLGLRAGRIKQPRGLYNEIRDLDMLRTSIVLPQGIYSDLLRDAGMAVNGVSLYGNVNLNAAGGLEYQLLAGAANSDVDSGLGKYTNSGLYPAGTLDGDITNDTTYSGTVRWETPLEGLRVGYYLYNLASCTFPVSYSGVQIPVDLSRVIQIFSAEYIWNDLNITAEYMLQDDKMTFMSYTGSTTSESYYLMASYRLTDWFALGAYYSEYYPNRDDKNGDAYTTNKHQAWQKDLALTLRFDINPYWIFKIEGHAVDGTAQVLAIDNPGNDFSSSHWYYGAAKVSFNF